MHVHNSRQIPSPAMRALTVRIRFPRGRSRPPPNSVASSAERPAAKLRLPLIGQRRANVISRQFRERNPPHCASSKSPVFGCPKPRSLQVSLLKAISVKVAFKPGFWTSPIACAPRCERQSTRNTPLPGDGAPCGSLKASGSASSGLLSLTMVGMSGSARTRARCASRSAFSWNSTQR